MTDDMRDGDAPEEIEERDDTGVLIKNERLENATKITKLFERYRALRDRTPTSEQVREMVTAARASIVSAVASKESFETLRQQVAEIRPPSMWKVAGGLAAFLLTIATIIWQASARVGDIALQNAIIKMQVDALDAAVKRLDAQYQALLLHQSDATKDRR